MTGPGGEDRPVALELCVPLERLTTATRRAGR